MARGSRIKGITIELDANVTPLQKALGSVDKSLKNTQASLKDINKLLKLDPSNTELLRQKQELLKKSIDDTKDRLKTLKEAYKQLDGKGTEEAKQQQELLAREISETESNLNGLKEEFRSFGSVASQQLQAVGKGLQDVGDKITEKGKDLSMKLTAPIVAVGAIGVNYNAQIEQYRTMFTTLTGSAEEADRIISQLQADAQKSPFDSASLIQANQYLISAGVEADEARTMINNLGNAVAATGGGSAELERMAQNLQQIQNVGKATSQDIKQFANAGINIYGLLAESTGKTVEEVKDMDVTYEQLAKAFAMASSEGGKYYGAMEAQGQTLNGSLSATKESIQMLLGSITESAMPIIVQVLQKVQEVINYLMNLDEGTKRTILIIGAVIAAIGPALTIIGSIVSMVGTLTSAIGFLISPMGAIVVAIGALIAAGVALYQNWDTIKQKFSEVWEKLKTDWQQIVDFFKTGIENLKSWFGGIKDAIANAFSFDGIKSKISGLFSFGSGGLFSSGGFSSGGFMSGGTISISNTFNVTNGNVTTATLNRWADVITDRINENLGRDI